MKSTELQTLWKLVKAGEQRPLSAADMALLLRIRFALQEYEASVLSDGKHAGGHEMAGIRLPDRTGLAKK